jgi:hypothetical protein
MWVIFRQFDQQLMAISFIIIDNSSISVAISAQGGTMILLLVQWLKPEPRHSSKVTSNPHHRGGGKEGPNLGRTRLWRILRPEHAEAGFPQEVLFD